MMNFLCSRGDDFGRNWHVLGRPKILRWKKFDHFTLLGDQNLNCKNARVPGAQVKRLLTRSRAQIGTGHLAQLLAWFVGQFTWDDLRLVSN
jgi:hypothetical protein